MYGVQKFSQGGHVSSGDDDIYSFEKKTNSNAVRGLTGFRTALGADGNSGGRPMTSVRAAGFSSRGRNAGGSATGGSVFDPMNVEGGSKPLEVSFEQQIKTMERAVNKLIEESNMKASEGNLMQALEKAKEAGKKERQLTKFREQSTSGDQMNLDLTYSVLFNLASQYHANKMYQEALNSFAVIVKNKLFSQSGRLRVNMGNIYFEQKKYPQAIKMYRMALDQVPNTNRDFRMKIMRNIGIAFVKMGQFQDAITSFEAITDSNTDHHAAFNLILCYFAIGDKDKMKRGFHRLLSIPPPVIEQNEDALNASSNNKEEPLEDQEVFNSDSLREIAREKKKQIQKYISHAAKLIAPAIDSSLSDGYDWVVESLRSSLHGEIASELEIAKTTQYLKTKDFPHAIESLKLFEKKDPRFVGTAATNLSFLYFLEGDYKQSEKYADLAIEDDRYNSKAHTNKGNCYFVNGDFERAREHYQEAISLDASCVESMYNLGLVNKRLELFTESLQWFEKLHSILRSSPEVIYQIADIYEKQGMFPQALEWYNILISVVPTDPSVLSKLGDLFEKDGDKSQAFHYYSESYRYFPSNLDVISWLGAYYVDCEVYEQAIQFFERAAIIQPNEAKWHLMIASCYRRSGNYQQAFETYKKIHAKFPDNVKCLRFLVRICTDLGMKEVDEYATKLAKAEKATPKEDMNGVSGRDSIAIASSFTGRSVRTGGTTDGYLDGETRSSVGSISNAPTFDFDQSSGVGARNIIQKKSEDIEFQEDVNGLLPD